MMQFLPSMKEQKMNEIIQYLTNNLTLPFIFILGMFHALEPGHGKTFILAYLTGGVIRVWGALQLIIALIVTHFMLFSLMAYLIKLGSDRFPIFLEFIGPTLIISLGVYLLYRSLKETRHEGDEDCDDPAHFHFSESKFSSPIVTGFVAGLIPCPSAVGVILISGITFSGPALYFSIFIYVLGIALTLIGIILLFLFFKEKAQNQLNSVNKKFNTNLIAAFLIITIGVLYLLMNLLGSGHQH